VGSENISLTLKFGQYLINRKIVSDEAVLTALDIQKARTPPIGKVAIWESKLNFKQINEILYVQSDSKRQFGQIAVEMGFLKKEDLNNLLELQNRYRPLLGEILIEMKELDRETLSEAIESFRSTTTA